jgi:hypothetical protein
MLKSLPNVLLSTTIVLFTFLQQKREYEKKSVNNHKVFYDTMKNHGGPLIMAKRERKPVHRVQMTDG